MDSHNAINHYNDWGVGSWTVWVGVLVLSLVALQAAVTVIANRADPKWAAALGLASVVLFPWSLYLMVRHAPTWRWAFLSVVVAVLVAAVIALRAEHVRDGKTFAITAGPFIGFGAALWIWDGLNRLASGIPTSVGVVVLAIVGGVIALWANTSNSSRSYR